MTIKPIQDLNEKDRFKLGPREFIIESISTKRQNLGVIDSEFNEVVLCAKSLDGTTEITGFFSEGILVETLDDLNNEMTVNDLYSELEKIKIAQDDREPNDEWETDHKKADGLLLKFINNFEVTEIYRTIQKWYS